MPLTDSIFKRHCYVVKQHDKHWPYLTCKETLTYAAELYEVAEKDEISDIVGEIIGKMGLHVCADTRCARLSGGQRRRLSIAIALLKQPTLLFLGTVFFSQSKSMLRPTQDWLHCGMYKLNTLLFLLRISIFR